jgi:hypothetical protein
MKYILAFTAAACLAVPFITCSAVLAPEPNLIDLADGALISRVRYDSSEFYKTIWYDNGLVVQHRKDGTFAYHYE